MNDETFSIRISSKMQAQDSLNLELLNLTIILSLPHPIRVRVCFHCIPPVVVKCLAVICMTELFCVVVSDEERHRARQPEEDKSFMNMLSQLGLKDKPIGDQKSSATDTSSSPQARWAAYLQSRIRASKSTSPQSSPEIPRSMSFDGHSGVNEDMRSKITRQRPLSVGCVGEGGLDQSFNPEQLRQKWLEEGSHSQR